MRTTWTPTTINRKLAACRSWARWARWSDTLDRYRAPKAAQAQPHPLPGGMGDIAAMLRVAGRNDRRAVLVALCGLCGLRVSEALAVRSVDVNVAQMMLLVRGKGDKQRRVPISPAAWSEISRRFVHASTAPLVPMFDSQARRSIKSLGQRTLNRDVASHDLRATFATAAYEQSLDLRAVQELLGHSDPKTTMVYVAVSDSAKRAIVAGVAG